MDRQHEAVIVQALRTPVGKYGGALKDVRVDDLSALVLRSLVERAKFDPQLVEDVFWGCANQAGEDNRNLARMALLLAGFPHSVPGTTINRLCGSSLEAIVQAARAIWSGDNDIVIAGGAESMTRAPFAMAKNVSGVLLYGNLTAYDTALGWRFPNPKMAKMFPLESMGETAENVASKFSISRIDQDEFALRSHRLAVDAQSTFSEEIVPVDFPVGRKPDSAKERDASVVTAPTNTMKSQSADARYKLVGDKSFEVTRIDEGPRNDTTIEKLAALKPVFRENGSVTAGNSSSLNDGAAGLIVMSREKSKSLGVKPIARIVASGVAGVDPRYMGIGPVPATNAALRRANLKLEDIGLFELNEAFAAQSLAVMRELNIDEKIVNVNGGAIALGHPLGCSGARIATSLVYEMRRRNVRYGIATMCIGVGQGIALIIENME